MYFSFSVFFSFLAKDNPDITMYDLNKQNVGGADVYGLLPDDDIHLNGWFSDYLLALHDYPAVKTQDACRLRTLYRMNQHGTRLNQDP